MEINEVRMPNRRSPMEFSVEVISYYIEGRGVNRLL